ncbi:MAG: hypothetical protein IT381_12705 [Deltaproteobacteria bacterium]|nr:hypothetical protein [Deltaproteobacteria bacterium]
MNKYEQQLDRMLARGRLSPDEIDTVLARALTKQETEAVAGAEKPKAGWRWALVPALSFGVVASLFLVLANPFSPPVSGVGGEFRARGQNKVTLAAECAAPCTAGSALVFRASPHAQTGYLAAYAASGDARIWYYPSAEVPSPELAPSTRDEALSQGAVIGPEHALGRYTVRLYLLSERLDRAAITALGTDDPRVLGYTEAAITVEERR